MQVFADYKGSTSTSAGSLKLAE